MTQEDLVFFKDWFSGYCRAFYLSNPEDQRNISLKELHTHHVCNNILQIARELSLDDNQLVLAEAIGLFHDVGRFPQYAQYKTFLDSISLNHGLLGSRVLLDEKVLGNLTGHEQEVIVQAVKFHNAFSVPDLQEADTVFFIRLLRDADKLDIWRVFIEYYEAPEEDRPSAVALGLPDTSGYSRETLSCLYENRMASLSRLKTLDDFKLMQLSWIYDLNFSPTFRLLLEREYIGRIIAKLPQTEEILKVSSLLEEYARQRAKEAVKAQGRFQGH